MVKQMELWAPLHPQEYGGMGLDLMEYGLVCEALARASTGGYTFGCLTPDAGNIERLLKYGTPEQKERYPEPLIAGRIRGRDGYACPVSPCSNPVMMDTTAVKDGGDYVINGHKWYTFSADGAELAIVMANTNPQAPPARLNDHRAHQRPRLPPGAQYPDYGARRQRLAQPCRDPLPVLPGASGQLAGTGGPGLRHRPGAPEAGAHPPLHALDRYLQPLPGADVPTGPDQARRPRPDLGQSADHSRPGSPRALPKCVSPA
ncbi:hypothetical protein DFAR_3970008 [Desulfarculales bacterium]